MKSLIKFRRSPDTSHYTLKIYNVLITVDVWVASWTFKECTERSQRIPIAQVVYQTCQTCSQFFKHFDNLYQYTPPNWRKFTYTGIHYKYISLCDRAVTNLLQVYAQCICNVRVAYETYEIQCICYRMLKSLSMFKSFQRILCGIVLQTNTTCEHCTPNYFPMYTMHSGGGMGDVGSARYEPALLPPCPTIRVLSYIN